MKKGERLLLIRKLATLLDQMNWLELDMTLRTFGLPWSEVWRGGPEDQLGYVLAMLERGDDENLVELHEFLTSPQHPPADAVPAPHDSGLWKPDTFRLFLSHDTRDKVAVAQLKACLSLFGIDSFVAHEDIEPTKEWLREIDTALRTCDAVAAYLTSLFHESKWTDQEIGFCMGRGVRIVPIRLGLDPYGLMMRYQGVQGLGKTYLQLAQEVFGVLVSREQKMAEVVVSTFEKVQSWEAAREQIGTVEKIGSWTPALLQRLEESVEKNIKIKEGWGVPAKIKAIVDKVRMERDWISF